jgi:hypothetical protein
MKTLITIASVTILVSGISVAGPHSGDEGSAIFDRYEMYGKSSKMMKTDELSGGVHPGSEGADLFSRYEMYGFEAHDHIHEDAVSSRENPDTQILDNQVQL